MTNICFRSLTINNRIHFQGYRNVHTSAEGKSGHGNISHAHGFYERWTSIRARGDRSDRIRLYILCPHTGTICFLLDISLKMI